MLIKDKEFELFLSSEVIRKRVMELASFIEVDYKDRNPLFLGVLNGCFIFAADLVRGISSKTEIKFVKISSYAGMKSTGKIVRTLNVENVEGRNIIIVEDIVDTGNTLIHFLDEVWGCKPESVEIATLLFKKEALQHHLNLKYIGFEIPDKFVVGYGLDYDEEGRNLSDIYQLKSKE